MKSQKKDQINEVVPELKRPKELKGSEELEELNIVIIEDDFFIREALKRLVNESFSHSGTSHLEANHSDSSQADSNQVDSNQTDSSQAGSSHPHSAKTRLDIFSSANGVEGLGYIFVSKPDFILVDTTLPKYSGREVIDYLSTNSSIKPNGRKIVLLTDGQKKLDFLDGYEVLNKSDDDFTNKLLSIFSKSSPKSKLKNWLIKKIIKTANKANLLIEKIKRPGFLQRALSACHYINWVLKQIFCSIILSLLNLITKKVDDANIEQNRLDFSQLRARYYPTLATFFTGFILVMIQVILLMSGGLTVYLWGEHNLRFTSVLADRSTKVAVSFNNLEYDEALVTIDEQGVRLKPIVQEERKNQFEEFIDIEDVDQAGQAVHGISNETTPDSYPESGDGSTEKPDDSDADDSDADDSDADDSDADDSDADDLEVPDSEREESDSLDKQISENFSYSTDKPSVFFSSPVKYTNLKSIREISNLNTEKTSLDLSFQPSSDKVNITYQLSPDGVSWYYLNQVNTVWEKTSKGWVSSNTIQEVNKNLASYDQQFSTGEVYLKIFLHSLSGEHTPVITDILVERELGLITNVSQELPQESQVQSLTITQINIDEMKPEIYSAAFVNDKKIVKGKLLTINKSLVVTYNFLEEELDKYEARIYFSDEKEPTKEELIGATNLYINNRGEIEFLLKSDSEPGGYVTAQVVKKEDAQISTDLAKPAKNDSFSVDSTLDTADAAIDGVCDDGSGNCTFRAAITEANQTHASEPDVIDFKIPVSDPGYLDYTTGGAGDGLGGDDYWSIKPTTELPAITEGVTIDGESQATFIGIDPNDKGPEIEIDGENLSGVDLITVNGAGTSINHIVVNNSTNNGIYVYASDFTLTKSYIGTDVTSYTAKPNYRGIFSNGWHVDNVTIGNDVTDGNVISGNTDNGYVSDCNLNDSLPPRTITVRGNIFGLSYDGEEILTTQSESMRMVADCDLEVGGPDESHRNVFSGSPYRSLAIVTAAPNFTANIENNFFGTDLTGTESRSSSLVKGLFIHSWTSAIDSSHPPIMVKNNLFRYLAAGISASDGFKYIVEENSFGDNGYGMSDDGFWTGNDVHYRTPKSVHNNYFGETNSDPYFGLSMGANDVGIESFGPMDIKGNQIIKNKVGIKGQIKVTHSAIDGNLFSYADIGGEAAFAGSLCGGVEKNCIEVNSIAGILFTSAVPSNESTLYSDNDFGNGNGPGGGINIQQEWFGVFELFSGDQRRTDLSRGDLNINFPSDKKISYGHDNWSKLLDFFHPSLGINQSVPCQSITVCPASGHTSGMEGETSVIVPIITYIGYDKELEFKFGYKTYKSVDNFGKIYRWYRITEYIIDNSGTKHDYGLWKVDDYHLVSDEFSFDGDATTHPVNTSSERIIENEYFDPTGSTTVNDSYYDRGEPWTNHPNAVRDVSSLDYSNFQVMELEVVDANPIQQQDGSYVITVDSVTNEDNVSLNFVNDGAGIASGGGNQGVDGISNAKTSLKEAMIVANQFSESVTIKFADNVKNYVPTEAIIFEGGANSAPDIIDGEGVVFDGINISGAACIDFNNQSNITIKNLEFRNCEQEAIRVSNGTSNKFESIITSQEKVILNPSFDQSTSGWFLDEATSITSISPDSLDSLVLWLDAQQGITIDTGVSVWVDQSGNGNDATQTTAGEQPTQVSGVLNGKSVIRFDGTDDWMSFPEITDVRSVFWVIKEDPSATDTYRSLLGHSTEANFHRGFEKALFFSSFYGTSEYVENGETFIRGEEVHPTWFHVDSNKVPTEHAIISLITTGDVAANQLTRDRNYADRGWWGDIAEVLIFNEPLSRKDQREVEKYLSEKYALPATYYQPQIEYQTEEVFRGDGGVKVTTYATSGKFTQQSVLQPGKSYDLSVYVKNLSSSPVSSDNAQLYFGSSPVSTTYTSQTDGWYKLSGQVIATEGEKEFGIIVPQEQNIYIDEFSLGVSDQTHRTSSTYTPINLIGGVGVEQEYGVTRNDDGDSDSGPNNLQNSAVISKVTYIGEGKYFLEGDLSANPSEGPFELELFRSDNHASGHGGSISPIGTIEIDSPWEVIVDIPGSDGRDGQVFTTLVTNSNNSTSEFGANFIANDSNPNYIIDGASEEQLDSDVEVITDDAGEGSPESYADEADIELTTSKLESYPEAVDNSEGSGLFGKIPGVVLSTLVPLFTSILIASVVSFALLMQGSSFVSGVRHIGVLLGILIPRKKKYWGIVFDAEKSKGIPFAIVRLKRKITENSVSTFKLATQTVTDEKGRYGMIVENPGNYIIEVLANGYERAERSIKFDVLSMQKEIVEDFPMVRVGEKLSWFSRLRFYNKDRLVKLFKLILLGLMILGFIYTVIVTLISPHILNYIMLAIYGLLFILNVVVLAKLRVCTIGQVQDEVTGEGLGGVSFRVYKDDKQVDLTLTNNQGEVKLNIKEGDYKAILNKRGYLGAVTEGKPIKVKTKASVKSKGEVSPVISVRIKKSGRLSENILMRRRSDEKFFTKSMLKKSINKGAAENGDTLASPFS